MRDTQHGPWAGKTVVIIGAARQGLALARYLARQQARVVVTDRRPAEDLAEERETLEKLKGSGTRVAYVLGEHPLSLLDGADLLCPSGGVPLELPLVAAARERGIPLSNDSQIFLEAAPCPVIGITGSAGKTTTTTLLGRMVEASQRMRATGGRAWTGGNIGSPLIARVEEMRAEDLAVMELSSFQLELMTRSPQVAVITNITPNHLDRHHSMAAYTQAKAHILDYQAPGDWAVLNREDPGAWGLRDRVKGRLLSFGLQEPSGGQDCLFLRGDELVLRQAGTSGGQERALLFRSQIELRGEHNLLNVLAACAAGVAAGLPDQALQAGIAGFRGVPHRLEFIRSWGGADWYNDSIATAPERVMAAIRSFDEPLVLLAGGRDKHLPWEDFAHLAVDRLDRLVVFGEAAGLIQAAVQDAQAESSRRLAVTRCSGLKEAVQAAARVVRPGQVVLLSPGGTSFDEFRDFEERGNSFARWVKELP